MSPDEWKIVDRFKEPSSYNALGTMLATFGVAVPSIWLSVISYVGSALCLAVGLLMKEGVK